MFVLKEQTKPLSNMSETCLLILYKVIHCCQLQLWSLVYTSNCKTFKEGNTGMVNQDSNLQLLKFYSTQIASKILKSCYITTLYKNATKYSVIYS